MTEHKGPRIKWLALLGLCAVVAAVLWHAARWQEVSSSSRKAFTVYGKCERGVQGRIVSPPKRIRLVIAPEADNDCDGYGIFFVDIEKLAEQKTFKMKIAGGDVVVDSLSFAIDPEDVKGWGGEGFQKETTSEGLRITYFADDIPDLVKGQYVIRENTVVKHNYLVSKTWPVLVLIGLVMLIVLAAIVSLIKFTLKWLRDVRKRFHRA